MSAVSSIFRVYVTRSFGPEKPKVFNQNVAEAAQHFTLRGTL